MDTETTEMGFRCREIRKDIFTMICNARCGHLGGSLSCVEILASLYFSVMNINPLEPDRADRDRFVNSKGHATAAYYATLANRGYFNREDLVDFFISVSSHFEEHGSRDVPGVDISTGSLGQGVSVGAGMALAARFLNRDFRAFVLVGDGECQEGQIWEGALFASHCRLDNLIVIIDRNGMQVSGTTEQIMGIEPLLDKWKSFNWEVFSVDGHETLEIVARIRSLKPNGKPKVIIAHTVKGKGISFMEHNPQFHSFRELTTAELKRARRELEMQ
jgi:transketolase